MSQEIFVINDEFKLSEDITLVLKFFVKLESMNKISRNSIKEIKEKYIRASEEIYKILDFDNSNISTNDDEKSETFQEMFNMDTDFKVSEDIRLFLNFSFKLFSENRIYREIKKEIKQKHEKICEEISKIVFLDIYNSSEEE